MREELVAMADLLGRVDVERSAVLGGEGVEVGSVAVQGAVAVGEGTGCRRFGYSGSFGQA